MKVDRSFEILGSRVDMVDMGEALDRIAALLEQHRFAHVVTFGSEMAMRARRDRSYRDAINAADLVVPDTIGVVYAGRMLGHHVRERVAGIDLLERVCAACARDGAPVYLVGGASRVASDAAVELQRRHPGLHIAGTAAGFFSLEEEREILASIRESGARVVLVALGFPKQETWTRAHASELGDVVCIGVGGSFDVISGRLRRAPKAMRKLGLEWLYRLIKEPQRLRRQLVLPQFACLVTGQALRERLPSASGRRSQAGSDGR